MNKSTWPVWATDSHWLNYTQQLAHYYTNRSGLNAWTTQYREQTIAQKR